MRKLIAGMMMCLLPLAAQAEETATKAAEAASNMAPQFTATTAAGEAFNLAAHRGKIVVLEWTNKYCPFVVKHYEAGNMQALQESTAGDDVVWVSIISSAPGKQGHMSAEEALAHADKVSASPDHIILDESGEIGQLYGAKTTPHMFVIDKKGALAYQGAIDSIPSADKSDIDKAENYVTAALNSLAKGQKVATPKTAPYGCSVKYAR